MPAVTVLYFASAQERCGIDAERVELPRETSADAVLALLGTRHPALSGILPQCRLALDQAFAAGPLVLSDGSELAVIPPVSGG